MDPYANWLSDYVDDALDETARRALGTHLLSCSSCRAMVEDLRQIKEAAGSLELLRPSEEIWGRIAGGIRARRSAAIPQPAATAGVATDRWTKLGSRWLVTALPVAAAVVLAAVAVWLLLPGSSPDSQRGPLVDSVQSELALAEQHYAKAISAMEKIVQEDEDSLDPQVVATLRRNLSLIERAIEESRAAVQQQPQSEIARESLMEGFGRKLKLLQNTILLINDLQKGRVDQNTRLLLDQMRQDNLKTGKLAPNSKR